MPCFSNMQVQCQLFYTQRTYCDFVVWTEKDVHIERIYPDGTFWLENVSKVKHLFKTFVLPELGGKFYSRTSDSEPVSLTQTPPSSPSTSLMHAPPPGPSTSLIQAPPPSPSISLIQAPPPGPSTSLIQAPPPGPSTSLIQASPPGPSKSLTQAPPPGPSTSLTKAPPPSPSTSLAQATPPGPAILSEPEPSCGSFHEPCDELLIQKKYCYCHSPEYGEMVGCDNPSCKHEWFHLGCLKLDCQPTSKYWYCPDCRKLPEFKQKRSKKSSRTT